jgi:hypothetical protein
METMSHPYMYKSKRPLVSVRCLLIYWAQPRQGQGLLHWIQLLEVLPYWNCFILAELVSLVEVFRLFKLESMFFGVQSVDKGG